MDRLDLTGRLQGALAQRGRSACWIEWDKGRAGDCPHDLGALRQPPGEGS